MVIITRSTVTKVRKCPCKCNQEKITLLFRSVIVNRHNSRVGKTYTIVNTVIEICYMNICWA